MRRMLGAVIVLVLAASAVAVFTDNASSQPRVTTTRQLQVIGAAATNQSHGAWFVDLQANSVIFCERAAAGIQCHAAGIP